MTLLFDIRQAPPTQEQIDHERNRLQARGRHCFAGEGLGALLITGGFVFTVLYSEQGGWGFMGAVLGMVLYFFYAEERGVARCAQEELLPLSKAACAEMLILSKRSPRAAGYRSAVNAQARSFLVADLTAAREGVQTEKEDAACRELHGIEHSKPA